MTVATIMCGETCKTRAAACVGPLEMAVRPGYIFANNITWRVPLCSVQNEPSGCSTGLRCAEYSSSDLVQVRDVLNPQQPGVGPLKTYPWYTSPYWTREQRTVGLSALCVGDSFKHGLIPMVDLPQTTELSVCHHVVNRPPPRPISRLHTQVEIMLCIFEYLVFSLLDGRCTYL